jgi:TonB family protein
LGQQAFPLLGVPGVPGHVAVGRREHEKRQEASGDGTSVVSLSACMERAEVRTYLNGIKDRTLDRWVLPPGVASDKRVTLRFRLDSAGSASNVSVVRAEDNALGASAVDALRSASPFPPMPESVRCLTQVPIVGTFSNPVAG